MTPVNIPMWLAPALFLFAGLLCLWSAFTIKGSVDPSIENVSIESV